MIRRSIAAAAACAFVYAGAAQAETLTCQFNQRGHDCNPTRCATSTISSGGKFRFDLDAKTMCVPCGDECVRVGTFGSYHRDEATGVVIFFIGDTRGAMTVRIEKDLFMVVATTSPTLAVSVFGGKCEK